MSARLERRGVVARLLRDRGDAVVVSGLGGPTWDVAAAGDCPRNLYLWGAMGGCVPMALGLALASPDVTVVTITGDGEMMMGIGSLAVVAQQAPANLVIVVLDNGEYGETGAQRAHTSDGADIAAMGLGAGLKNVRTVASPEEVEALASELDRGAGPVLAVVRVAPGAAPGEPAMSNVLRDAAHGRARTRAALGLPVD